jgi:putative tryptophan/tyrosine transport system substrate-binding protein
VKRREFITLLGGAAVAWPFAVHVQRGERKPRVGVLMPYAADDPEIKSRLTAFRQALDQLGSSEGHNMHIDYRFAAGSSDRYLPLAQELTALPPDVIVAVT